MASQRFPIAFERAYAVLSASVLLLPSSSFIAIEEEKVTVRMGWAFRATFDRARVARTKVTGERVRLTRGVHGWNGRWLVNGAGDGILSIELAPASRGWVMGFPVLLRELLVSVDDPAALARALAR